MYDLFNDPYELDSLHDDPAYAAPRAALAERLRTLASCAGASCKASPQLTLKLVASRKQGRRCLAAPVRLGTKGSDAGLVRKTVLYVNGRSAGADVARPFLRKVPYARLASAAVEGADATHPARRPPPHPRHPPASLPLSASSGQTQHQGRNAAQTCSSASEWGS